MEKTNVVCVGWGSPTRRPHSWITAYNNNSQRCHQGSGRHASSADVNNSPCRQRNKRHDMSVGGGEQNVNGIVGSGAGMSRNHRGQASTLCNPRCRSLIEENPDPYRMYSQHRPVNGQPQVYPDRTDAYRYQQADEDNNKYVSNANIKYGDGGCYGQTEINSNIYSGSHEQQHVDAPRAECNTYGIDPYNSAPIIVGTEYHHVQQQYDSSKYRSPDHNGRNHKNKYPDNQLLDYNTNQLDLSPEKVSSSGSSFDSGYHSTYSSGTGSRDYGCNRLGTSDVYHHGSSLELYVSKRSSPVHNRQHAPYQLSQKFSSYQSGIKRTLDKCEDHCVQVIHPSLIWAEQQSEWESIILVKYIGSFSVIGEDQNARAEYVRKQLLEMRNVTKTKPVLLVISLSGIKVCSSTGESVYMAHALKRISYATCDPDCCQFSFLAREPKGHTNIQYCHAFVTKTALEAEELNAIVGNAFKMAFTYQRERQKQASANQQQCTPEGTEVSASSPPMMQRQPTFHELIEQQIEVQREQNEEIQRRQQEELTKRLSEISTAKIDERIKELNERKKKKEEELEREQEAQRLQRLQGKDRTSWAKHVAGRTKHKSPLRTPLQVGMGDPQSKHTSSPQSHRQSTNVLNQATNGHTNSPNSSQANAKQSPFTSISALRDAFNAGELRSYGSPVMTLKETIDKIPWSGDFTSSATDRHSQGSNCSEHFVDYGQGEPESPEPGPSYQANSVPDFSQRPLPATPPEIQRPKVKGQRSSNQKSPPLADEHHSRPQSNGHMPTTSSRRSRPLSGKYQNESPMHSRFVDTEDTGDMYQGPPTPLRYDSLRKIDRSDAPIEEDLKNAPWYQAGIPREIALEMLTQEEVGSFVVRDSTTHPGCYALSVKVPKFDNPSGISHYLITRTPHGGVKLKGLDKEWSSLTALVTHHSVMRELLPCPLRLPRIANNPAFNDEEKTCEQEEDEDYQRLADFSHMMQDLKM